VVRGEEKLFEPVRNPRPTAKLLASNCKRLSSPLAMSASKGEERECILFDILGISIKEWIL
jgi:hypothetical protein